MKKEAVHVGFATVKGILDKGLDEWEKQNGPANLSHHSKNFGRPSWATKAALLAAVGHGHQLIQPDVIGNNRGSEANLVIDLRKGINPPVLDRMPLGGPYISDAEIQQIEDWINAGCPD